MTLDARKDPRIWKEVCVNERAHQRRAPSYWELAARRGGSDKRSIEEMRERLAQCSADYLWQTADVPSPPSVIPDQPQPKTSAMAELAMGVGDAETTFLRQKPPQRGHNLKRTAHAELSPTMAPWQMNVDSMYWRADALDRWNAQQKAGVLQMPPPTEPRPRIEATISGPHAGSVAAWRRSEVPLSQWEVSERSDSLIAATKFAESSNAERSRAQLSKLLQATRRVSDSTPASTRAKWHER